MSGRQEEVSLQWDMIEQELQNPSFWGFLSNIDGDQMPTRELAKKYILSKRSVAIILPYGINFP